MQYNKKNRVTILESVVNNQNYDVLCNTVGAHLAVITIRLYKTKILYIYDRYRQGCDI